MTAADRPSVTDNARAEAMRLWPGAPPGVLTKHQVQLDMARRRGFIHGAEWAAGRAETTTATTEDTVTEAARLIDSSIPDDVPGYRYRYAEQAAQAMASRGLLATARTRPTREQMIQVLAQHDPENTLGNAADWYYTSQADAVLALWADQPTEAEAGARALEQAAEEIDWEWETFTAADGHTSIRQHGAAPSTLLRERAARLRGGGDQ